MTTASRFKSPVGDTTPRGYPVVAGMCRYCRREFWNGNAPDGSALLHASQAYPGCCDACGQWLRRNPGGDPRTRKGHLAERIPAERAEADPTWRHHPDGLRCHQAPPELFDPEPDPDDRPAPDDPGYDVIRRAEWRQRRDVARVFCDPCPVRSACKAAALAQGWEGLWGGTFFERRRWHDLLDGTDGPTMHAPARDRKRAEAELAQLPA
jgi:hypothetical protein